MRNRYLAAAATLGTMDASATSAKVVVDAFVVH